MPGKLKKCKHCSKTTKERTVGTPNGSCPERPHLSAQHNYYIAE